MNQLFNPPQLATLWRRYSPVVWTVCIGVAFSLVVFSAVRWWEYQDIEKEFRLAAEDRALAVKGTFQTETAMLELVRSALEDDTQVRRNNFRRLVSPFGYRSRSIEAVEWVPRVFEAERAKFVSDARRHGIEGYHISEMSPNGKMIPAPKRKNYFPILFIGPRSGLKTVYGYDVASEPVRRESLLIACDTGETVASGQIDFVQDEKKTVGFLVVLPVYKSGKTLNSVAARRANLRGFVIGVFRPDDMLTAALTKLHPEGIDVCLYNPAERADGRPIPFHASRTRKTPWEPVHAHNLTNTGKMHYTAKLDVAGSPWTVACIATSDFVAARRSYWPWGVFAAGVLLSTLMGAYVKSSIDRKSYVDQLLVEKRLHADELQDKVLRQTWDIRRAQEEVIFRLLSATQCRDEETGAHVRRVGLMSEVLAHAAGWSNAEAEGIRQAAPMHDVGKIGIPDAILRKPGKLTADEFEIMKTHTLLGAEMLANSKVPMLQMAAKIALGHHERWDGHGYPNKLSNDNIPECARITAIADVYDALTHARVYKPAMPEEEALAIMRSESGTQFDPLLLAHFFLHLPEIRRIARENPDRKVEEPVVEAKTKVESQSELQPVE